MHLVLKLMSELCIASGVVLPVSLLSVQATSTITGWESLQCCSKSSGSPAAVALHAFQDQVVLVADGSPTKNDKLTPHLWLQLRHVVGTPAAAQQAAACGNGCVEWQMPLTEDHVDMGDIDPGQQALACHSIAGCNIPAVVMLFGAYQGLCLFWPFPQ